MQSTENSGKGDKYYNFGKGDTYYNFEVKRHWESI